MSGLNYAKDYAYEHIRSYFRGLINIMALVQPVSPDTNEEVAELARFFNESQFFNCLSTAFSLLLC